MHWNMVYILLKSKPNIVRLAQWLVALSFGYIVGSIPRRRIKKLMFLHKYLVSPLCILKYILNFIQ